MHRRWLWLSTLCLVFLAVAPRRAHAADMRRDHAFVETAPTILVPWTSASLRAANQWYWEPTHIGQALSVGLILWFVVQFVPPEVRAEISRDVWAFVKDRLHRAEQWVTGHPQNQNAAWVELNVQGYDSNNDNIVDSYGEWDDVDYDDDGTSDYRSSQTASTTPQQVTYQLDTYLANVDAYLRRQGR